MKKALITGMTGQDGSYLTEFLLEKGYEVHGIVRRTSAMARTRIDHLEAYRTGDSPRLFLHYGDLGDPASLTHLLYQVEPEEIYNLAGQSQVGVSFELAEYTCDSNAMGVVRILEGIVKSGLAKKTRFYQASSSEMYGAAKELPLTENSLFHPRSPYACAKVMAHHLTVNYREAYGLYACCGILFNHESPRRGENFVTRKITRAVGRLKAGSDEKLTLGNLDAVRDWGYAPEFVEAMWLMLQQEQPDDYVIATNESHSVKAFLEEAFICAGLDVGDHVAFDERFLRPSEVDEVRGDYAKARTRLGWEPKVRMKELVRLMVASDITLAGSETGQF